MPRTGTTALHRLLSLDPQFQSLPYWLGRSPCIRPPRSQWHSNRDFKEAQAELAELYRVNPSLRRIHAADSGEADECRLLLCQDFLHDWLVSIADVPSYDRFVQRADPRHAYVRYADNLRVIGLNDLRRRWLLKDPAHIFHLETLCATFPDARIIQTHRDPSIAVGSLCSLVVAGREVFGTAVDKRKIGQSIVATQAAAMRRMLEARHRLSNQFVDVHFADLVDDPMRVIDGIYRQLGLELREDVMLQMRHWLAEHRRDREGTHRYSLQEFSLQPDSVRAAFARYMEHYRFESRVSV